MQKCDRGFARQVGTSIKQARLGSGRSRDHIARSAGLTSRELARYERGTTIPCRRDIRALAGACGIEGRDLLAAELMARLAE